MRSRIDESTRAEDAAASRARGAFPAFEKQNLLRRGFVLASVGFGLSALLACAAKGSKGSKTAIASAASPSGSEPEGLWTESGGLPPKRYAQPVTPPATKGSASASKNGIPSTSQSSTERAAGNSAPKKSASAPANTPAHSTYAPASIPSGYSAKPIPRRAWTTFVPNAKEMEAMPRVTRITVHHEGNHPFYGTSVSDVRARLVNVLNGEMNAKNPHKDIAYHFVIDPAGRVWEARDLKWEGRHTRNNYDGNLGVMCLGNFEEQSIPAAQLAALEKFIAQMQLKYTIARKRVYTHQELSPTLCPGKDLQKKMGAMRSRLK